MYKYISFQNHYIIDTEAKTINNIPLYKFKSIIENRICYNGNFENFKTRLTKIAIYNPFPSSTEILEIQFDNITTSLYHCKDLFMIVEAIDWINGKVDKLDIYHFQSIEILCIDDDLFFLSPNGISRSSIKNIISNIYEREEVCKDLRINNFIFNNMLDSLILQLENKNKGTH